MFKQRRQIVLIRSVVICGFHWIAWTQRGDVRLGVANLVALLLGF